MSGAMAGPPRMCLLVESFFPMVGGGETYARAIAARLHALGVPVFVVTRRIRRDLKVHEIVDGVPVHRVPPTGMVRFGKYAMLPVVALTLVRLRRLYDVVYVVNFRTLGPVAVLTAKLLRKKCILRAGICGEFSGRYVADHATGSPRAASWLAAPLALRTAVLRQADGFVSNCEAVAEEFRRHGAAQEKIARLPGGTDTEMFHPVEPAMKRHLRRRLGLSPERFLIGYAGKLNRGKGLEHLLAALPAILRRHPKAHVVLIGSGVGQFLSQEAALRELVRVLGLEERVTFTGYVENVAEYLQSLDLFVFPTEHEALPNALMEAMACGLPCVASRVGGVPDLVQHEVTGLLVEPGAPAALEQALARLAADPDTARRFGAAARRAMEERFSLDVLARKHRDFVEDVVRAGWTNGCGPRTGQPC